MKMGASEIGRIVGVDRNLVKEWSCRFQEHLSPGANPGRGSVRQFSLSDLQVFLYVYSLWEDEPDFENINAGLRQGLHLDERHDDVLASVAPLFQEPPEDLDVSRRHGALVGGMAACALDTFSLADSYKLAGDVLVDAAMLTAEAYELIYPILFNYRHATELYLKATVVPAIEGHRLTPLLDRLRNVLRRDHTVEIPEWFENIVKALEDFDPRSTTFRYVDAGFISRRTGDSGEFWIDLCDLKRKMNLMAESFQRVRRAQR